MKIKYFFSFALLFFLLLISVDAMAQCPMCRMSAESNMATGGTAGKGLNKGILYMLALPYLMVSVLGYIWYKNRKKNSENTAMDLPQ